jgi:hypothetical protein
MTRQLISTNKQPLLRSSHAKRPPQNGFVQVAKPDMWFFFVCVWISLLRFRRLSVLEVHVGEAGAHNVTSPVFRVVI